jgi:hypothetical protein
VPAGPEWLHEIKHHGFRIRVERDGDRVRLITRGGYDLSLDHRVHPKEPHQAARRSSWASLQFQNTNFPTNKAKTLTHATVTLINVTDSITPTARSRPLSSGQSNQRFIAVSLNQVDR